MAQHLLARSAALFDTMMASRRAAVRPAGSTRNAAEILSDIDARLARPAPLPSLRSALSRRAALFGPVEVDA